MSNIIIEFCPEDRARLDKIIEGLTNFNRVGQTPADPKEQDDVQKKLAETMAKVKATTAKEAPTTAQEVPDHPTANPFPERATEGKQEPPAGMDKVSASDFQQLAIALCRQKKQPEIRAVLAEYGLQTVSEVLDKLPEEKHGEVYAKLKALEG